MASGGKRLVVLGGGLSSLSFVHYLRTLTQAFGHQDLIKEIIVVEASDQMGGSTVRSRKFDDGIVHELGTKLFRTQGPRSSNLISLAGHIGLGDQIEPILQQSLASRKYLIYDNKRLFEVPKGPAQLFKKFPDSNKRLIGAIINDLFMAKKMDLDSYPDCDPPIYEFVKHRFGQAAAEKLADPLMRATSCGDIRKLSTRANLGDLLDCEQTYGSVLKGIRNHSVRSQSVDDLFKHDLEQSETLKEIRRLKVFFYSLKSGNQSLAERLCNTLLNTNQDQVVSIYNQTEAVSVRFNLGDKMDDSVMPCSVLVRTVDGQNVKIDADHIISGLPSTILMRLLEDSWFDDKDLSLDFLKQIEYARVASVVFEYRNLDIDSSNQALNSLGVIANRNSDARLVAFGRDSSHLNPNSLENKLGVTKINCTIGPDELEKLGALEELRPAQIEQLAIKELEKLAGIQVEPHRASSRIWSSGFAQYSPGHTARLGRFRGALARKSIPLSLLGQSYDGSTASDVIFNARVAANELMQKLSSPKLEPLPSEPNFTRLPNQSHENQKN